MSESCNQASHWISGCTEWIEEHVTSLMWMPYYINFMFEPLPGSPAAVVAQMHKAVMHFYGRFCTEFVRNTRAESQQDRLPRLWLFPDKPTWKRDAKLSVHEVKFNDNGLHLNGPLLLPRFSRFREDLEQHITDNQGRYAQRGISRIHVKPMSNLRGIADYAAKTLKWDRVDESGILILPRTTSELERGTNGTLSPRQRAIKDIQARTNVSFEVAAILYDRTLEKSSGSRRR